MELNKTLWVYPYMKGSKSAKLLAETLGVLRIKQENSNFHGKKGRIVLNWGAGTGVFNCKAGDATVWNTTRQIDAAVNKLDFFRIMTDAKDPPNIPWWTSEQAVARRWLKQGHAVVARQELEGCKGRGVVLMKKPLDFVPAPLYTKKESSTAEYRVYMFQDQVIDSRIKLLGEGKEADPDGMRYHEDRYEFCRHGAPLPGLVTLEAMRTMKVIGLMTGGVDVLWNKETGEAVVLEVNTAPYIGELTAKRYATAITKYLEVA